MASRLATWEDILAGNGPSLYGDEVTRRIPGLPENWFRYYRPMSAPDADPKMIREISNPATDIRNSAIPPDPMNEIAGLGGLYPGIGGKGMALMTAGSPPGMPGGGTPAVAHSLTNTPVMSATPITPSSMRDWLATYLSSPGLP